MAGEINSDIPEDIREFFAFAPSAAPARAGGWRRLKQQRPTKQKYASALPS
jgi:hypothetical protein